MNYDNSQCFYRYPTGIATKNQAACGLWSSVAQFFTELRNLFHVPEDNFILISTCIWFMVIRVRLGMYSV